MNIKKITAAVMAVTILAGLTACGNTAEKSVSESTTAEATTVAETTTTVETTTVVEETTTTSAETTVTEETTTTTVSEEESSASGTIQPVSDYFGYDYLDVFNGTITEEKISDIQAAYPELRYFAMYPLDYNCDETMDYTICVSTPEIIRWLVIDSATYETLATLELDYCKDGGTTEIHYGVLDGQPVVTLVSYGLSSVLDENGMISCYGVDTLGNTVSFKEKPRTHINSIDIGTDYEVVFEKQGRATNEHEGYEYICDESGMAYLDMSCTPTLTTEYADFLFDENGNQRWGNSSIEWFENWQSENNPFNE